jgi:hypothetical protein
LFFCFFPYISIAIFYTHLYTSLALVGIGTVLRIPNSHLV